MAEEQLKQHELQRSSKQTYPFSRERSFVRPQSQYQQPEQYYYHLQVLKEKRKSVPLQNVNPKGKPTMEIYRPPNVRTDGTFATGNGNAVNPKLNVHAKEFTMKTGQLQSSRSSGNILLDQSSLLQESLANGGGLHDLQQSLSVSNVPPPKVHFCLDENSAEANSTFQSANQFKSVKDFHGKNKHAANTEAPRQVRFQGSTAQPGGLQRSKSLGAADMATRKNYNQDANDLGCFPPQIQAIIFKAIEDPNQLSARTLMELVRHLMERVVESRKFAEPAAKLCIKIIEKENKETFLESLLNTCQQWYQERDRILKGTSPKISAFMAFLNEMYCQLKRRQLQLKTHHEGVPPGLVLLTLLSKCCQDCLVSPSISSLSEMESVFFVLTAVGKDLEQELPRQLDGLLNGVRDAFLAPNTAPPIRKTLLQLIELSAARWQLPAPAVMYYYPGTYK
ncbi:UNVERIFIED_CONTAM: hypothetical protein PYX00_005735 [Menopon gallinae]|uniref:MIF4G domain-containing protein n=1 Tax=Menopon gallinae TaxID=328185 RepID=A0AAW2HT88_9NEOP